MKPSQVLLASLVLAVAACANSDKTLAADQPAPGEMQPVKILDRWHGKLAEAAPRKLAPTNGIVLDQQTWTKLWKAWRGDEKLPAVDFTKHLVLVFTADGPNSVGCEPMHDGRGNIQANAMSTLIGGGKGFGYLMLRISREGVKTVNGKPLPGEKAPAEIPRPRRPGRPGAVPGSSGDEPGSSPPGAAPVGEPGVVVSPAAADAALPPLKELDPVAPKASVFDNRTWKQPLVLKSQKEAAAHFDEEALAKLAKQVDFNKQIVLVFAWRGSGQDKLDAAIAESYPEQIFFRLTPGRTRDLREHVRLYALRANVKWSVK